MQTGRALASQLSLNGNAQRRIVRSKEILSRTKRFIRNQLRLPCKLEIFIKCLATFGNGRAAPIHLIPLIAPLPAHSANTTESSCATSTSCEVAPALGRALIFAAPIVTFSNLRNAGNSPESGWRAIHNNSVGRDRRARAERKSHDDCELHNGSAARCWRPTGKL